MTPQETVKLVRLVSQLAPAQKIDEFTPDVWHPVVSPVSMVDALEAVKVIAGRQAWIAPHDIIAEVKKLRAKRLDGADARFFYTGDPDDVAEYRRQLAAHRQHAADGQDLPPELEPHPRFRKAVIHQIQNTFRSVPPARITRERGHQHDRSTH